MQDPPRLPADAPPSAAGFVEPRRARLSFLERLKAALQRWIAWVGGFTGRRETRWTPPFVTMQDGRRRKPRVLFLDAGNATRSQMAEAFALHYGFHAESAGTFPAREVPAEVSTVMAEKGHDLAGQRPKLLDLRRVEAFDRVILFGQVLPAMYRNHPNIEEWTALDPQGFPVEGYRMVRDQVERLVHHLARNWQEKVQVPVGEKAAEPPAAA